MHLLTLRCPATLALGALTASHASAQFGEFDTSEYEVSNAAYNTAELGDVDGDGDLDTVGYRISDGNVVWIENTLRDTGTWGAATVVGGLADTTQIQIIDVDGDGPRDVVAFSAAGQQLVYFRNLGTSPLTFDAPVVLASSAAPASLVASKGFVAADFDGDGDAADFVVGDDKQILYIEDADPSSAADISGFPPLFPGAGVQKVAAGDFDGVGGLDVALSADINGGSLLAIMNTGTTGASFSNAFRVKSGFAGASYLAVANLDGQHGDDLVLSSTAQIDVFLSDGSGLETFVRQSIPKPTSGDIQVRLGDLDGVDGPDLITTGYVASYSEPGDRPFFALNTGDASSGSIFGSLSADLSCFSCVTTDLAASCLAVGDVDTDGFTDVVARDGNKLTSFIDRTVGPPATIPFTFFQSVDQARLLIATALGDLDGDGDPDVVGYSETDSFIYWTENRLDDTGAFATSATVGGLADTTQIQIVDVDGDGPRDVVAFSAAGQQLVYFRNLGTSPLTFDAPVVLASSAAPASLVASKGFVAADFDGDGDAADFVVGDDKQILYIEDADPSSAADISGFPPLFPGAGVQKVAAGDFDGVGGLDVALSADINGGSLLAIMNTGTTGASFSNAFRVKSGFNGANDLAVGNVDGQHGDDVVLASAFRVDVFQSNGTGLETFTRGTGTTVQSAKVALGNLDGVNGPDLFILQRDYGWYEYVLNNGASDNVFGSDISFANTNYFSATDQENKEGFAFGDLDQDGFDDVVWGRSGKTSYHENLSTLGFVVGCGFDGILWAQPGASLSASGSSVLASNDVTLQLTDLPSVTVGYFINSFLGTNAPGAPISPGGSVTGQLCIGGTGVIYGRHTDAIFNSGLSGTASLTLDLNLLRNPRDLATLNTSYTAVAVGETWYWQAWYRATPTTSEFSHAIGITFR